MKRDLLNLTIKCNMQFLFEPWLKQTGCKKNLGDERAILNNGYVLDDIMTP